ncbi:MAG: glycosyltransferase family 9 protein [Ignavibacteria bacterium]|nr:glycosyltransferase family 9 protein [Ignavibacteria bacterium]
MSIENRILVIRLSSFGDIVLTFPFLKQLKQKFPNSKIYFLTKSVYGNLVELSHEVDRIILYDNNFFEIKNLIKKENFDYIFDLQKNYRSIALTFKLKGKKIRYKKENFKKFLLIKFKINLFKKVIPVYKKYLLTLKGLVENLDFSYHKVDLNFDRNPRFNFNYILLAPSSKHYTKTYPTENFINIIKKNESNKYVLVGDNSQRDIDICNMISKSCENTINLCNKTNFIELANLIYNADYIICNDSGVLHLAELLGKKVYAFFGSTVKEFGFYPQLPTTVIFENENLKCRPCSRHGLEKCPKKHFKCMKEIQQNVL